jgi:DNA-binding transcriptional LysR family regulator
VMGDPVDSIPRLRAGELDLALAHDAMTDGEAGSERRSGMVQRTPDIEIEALFEDPMYVAMASAHRLSGAGPLSLADFADDSWMLATSDTCPDSRLFLRACHDAGFEPRIAFQNDDYGAIMGFVAAGVGVALIPDMVARGVREDIVIRPLEPSPPPRPIGAVLPAGYRSPAAAAMLGVLREISAEWVRGRLSFAQPAIVQPAAAA